MDRNLGRPELLSAVAVGDPGKRTFFIAVGEHGRWLRVWLEKQDVQALAAAIRELFLRLSQMGIGSSAKNEDSVGNMTSKLPAAELELREASLGFEDGNGRLDFVVEAVGPSKESQSLETRPTLAQLKSFADEAEKVCSAGRPICSVCGQPIDPSGHDCPGKN